MMPQCAAMHWVALTLYAAVPTSLGTRPSSGCRPGLADSIDASSTDQGLVKKLVRVADFADVSREYWVKPPPHPAQPAPLLLGFHGQSGTGKTFGASHRFAHLGHRYNLMTVYPNGMDDAFPGEDQSTGWNVGSAGDNATCSAKGVGANHGCYKSCRALRKCGRCNWSTCYDDVKFVKTVVHAVAQEFCIDLDRIYAQGESNGAEFVQHLVRELPDTFAAVATWFGTPLVGYLLGRHLELVGEHSKLSRTAILALHGRNDTTIPPQGGVSDGGWIFEPLKQSTGVWAALHRCSMTATALTTRWDGGPKNFQCVEHRHCSTGRRVVQCMYDGVHGDWPSNFDGDEMTLWFFLQFNRSMPLASLAEDVNVVQLV